MGVVSVLPPRRYDAAAVVAVLYNYCLFVRLRAEEEEGKGGARATYQLSVSATRKKEGRWSTCCAAPSSINALP